MSPTLKKLTAHTPKGAKANTPMKPSRQSFNSTPKPRMASKEMIVNPCHEKQLSSSLQEAFSRRQYVDSTIVCKDVTFYAHRTVLALFSDYFAQRVNDSVVRIEENVDPKSLKSILQWIYFGSVEVDQGRQLEDVRLAAKILGVREFPYLTPDIAVTTETTEDTLEDSDVSEEVEEVALFVKTPTKAAFSPIVSKVVSTKDEHMCKKCGSGHGSMDDLIEHMLAHSPAKSTVVKEAKQRNNQCPKCKKSFVYPGKLIYHARKMHGMGEDELKLKGSESQKVDEIAEKTNSIIEKSGSAKVKDVALEDSALDNPDDDFMDLSDPETAVDAEELSQSGYNASQSGNDDSLLLNAEVAEHAGTQSFKCADCNKEYTTKIHLKRHTCVPNPSNRNACPQCNKSFKYRTSLNSHISNKHVSKSPAEKEKSAAETVNLTVPVTTTKAIVKKRPSEPLASGEKRKAGRPKKQLTFPCDICGQRSPHAGGLKKHVERCHPESTPNGTSQPPKIKCANCTDEFDTEDDKDMHNMVYH